MHTHTTAMPFVRNPATGSIVNVLGVIHTYKATENETAGSDAITKFTSGTLELREPIMKSTESGTQNRVSASSC